MRFSPQAAEKGYKKKSGLPTLPLDIDNTSPSTCIIMGCYIISYLFLRVKSFFNDLLAWLRLSGGHPVMVLLDIVLFTVVKLS